MFMNRFIPVTLIGLLFVSHPVFSEETAAQPEPGGSAAGVAAEAVAPAPAQETATPASGMEMGEHDMMGGPKMTMGDQGSADKNEGMAMEPGMQGPGKEGCRMGKGGMKGMMHGGMGKGGMMGGGMEKGGKMGCRMGQSGITQEQYRELIGRLDVLDARMAKIDAMLERLLER
jgi:hypothetical protein